MTTKTLFSLAEKTALLILLDAWTGLRSATDDAKELLYDLGILTSIQDFNDPPLKPSDPIFAALWRGVFWGLSMDAVRRLLIHYGLLRRREGKTKLTTLAKGLMADEVAGRL